MRNDSGLGGICGNVTLSITLHHNNCCIAYTTGKSGLKNGDCYSFESHISSRQATRSAQARAFMPFGQRSLAL